MKKNLFYLLFLLFSLAAGLNAQFLAELKEKVKKTSEYFPREKAYLHIDKSYYFPGDLIWMKAYVMDASYSQPSTLGLEMNIILFSPKGEIVTEQLLRIKNGTAIGAVSIANDAEEGMYYLTAYSNWMQNLPVDECFRVLIPVIKPIEDSLNLKTETGLEGNPPKDKLATQTDSSVKISFFPESDNLIEEVENKIAFYTEDVPGKPASVKGAIFNENNDRITTMSTDKHGLGAVTFIPQTGTSYYLALKDSSQKYFLPSSTSGTLIKYLGKSDSTQNFLLVNSDTTKERKYFSFLRGGEKIYWSKETLFSKKSILQVPVSELPEGALCLSLFNEEKTLLCERSFFNKNDKEHISCIVSMNYDDNEAEIILQNKEPVKDDLISLLSASFTPREITFTNDSIIESFHLRSELELPYDYDNLHEFYSDNELLDLLMLTSSSRKIEWSQILDVEKTKNSFYPFESFSGMVVNKQDEPVLNAKVRIVSKDLKTNDRYTNAKGEFSFAPLRITKQDIENLYVEHPRESEGLRVLIKKTYKEKLREFIKSIGTKQTGNEKKLTAIKDALTDADRKYYEYLSGNTTSTDSPDKKESGGLPYYLDFLKTHTLLETINYIRPFTIQNRQIVFLGTQKDAYLYGGAIIMINGISYGRNITILETLYPGNITEIRISTNPVDLMRYTSAGASGLIEISTIIGGNRAANQSNRYDPGFSRIKKFLSPDFEEPSSDNINMTIYWDPDITLEEDNEEDYDFSIPSLKRKYDLTIEGFDNQGRLMHLIIPIE